jgi:hypothetical protein
MQFSTKGSANCVWTTMLWKATRSRNSSLPASELGGGDSLPTANCARTTRLSGRGAGRQSPEVPKNICAMIRSSGSANLAKVHACAFPFLEMTVGNIDSVPIRSTAKQFCNNDIKMKAQVMVHGALHYFANEDLELIDKSTKSAYNDAFLSAALSLVHVRWSER